MMPGMRCPMCGGMMGSGQQPQTGQNPDELRRQIRPLQQRLDQIKRVQRLAQQVRQVAARLRALEGCTQGGRG